jgi:hypothetical protein
VGRYGEYSSLESLVDLVNGSGCSAYHQPPRCRGLLSCIHANKKRRKLDRRWIQFHLDKDRGGYSYSMSWCLHSRQRRNSLVPTPRVCHVEDFRSGHGTILKEVTVVCSRIGGSLGRGGFLGVGAERYPGLHGPWFDYCPNSERGNGSAWDSRSG